MTGCGAPGAPGIIRCLRKNGERDIRIVAVDRNENAGARDLVDAFYTVPSAEKEDFLPAVLDICRRESVQVVIPIVTRELMKFARARAEFEALGAQVSVMEPDKLEIVNNKAYLLDAMRAHGLRTPEYRRVHTVEKLKAAVSALGALFCIRRSPWRWAIRKRHCASRRRSATAAAASACSMRIFRALTFSLSRSRTPCSSAMRS